MIVKNHQLFVKCEEVSVSVCVCVLKGGHSFQGVTTSPSSPRSPPATNEVMSRTPHPPNCLEYRQ